MLDGLIAQNQTLTVAVSPYTVTADLEIQAGVVLTIEPGVIVKIGSKDIVIKVNGKIVAEGSQALPIEFTSVNATGDSWQKPEIKFVGNGSSLSYCQFNGPVSYTHLTLPTNREV